MANREAATEITRFSYSGNNFSFEVAAPSFVDERSIRYSYLLQGSGNESWSEPSNNAAFNAVNLSPGSYTLLVKAEFPEALYPPQQLSYSFAIEPPCRAIPGMALREHFTFHHEDSRGHSRSP